jgi:hypothetical protein
MTAPLTRLEAQQRVEQIRAFTNELARLEDERALLLSVAQRRSLQDHHRSLMAELAKQFDVDRDSRSQQLSLGMRIASFLGALALAASVFFLFYRFWGVLGTATQVTALLAASALTYGATLWIRNKDENGYFSKLAAMVAFACFVLNVTMLGDIFNIAPSDKALLPWAAYAFLLAYLCELRLLLVTALLCNHRFHRGSRGRMAGAVLAGLRQAPGELLPRGRGDAVLAIDRAAETLRRIRADVPDLWSAHAVPTDARARTMGRGKLPQW